MFKATIGSFKDGLFSSNADEGRSYSSSSAVNAASGTPTRFGSSDIFTAPDIPNADGTQPFGNSSAEASQVPFAIRVAIVDDHPIIRSAVRGLLAPDPYVRCVAEAENGAEALKILTQREVDVLLLDMTMPGLSGFELIKQVVRQAPGVRVIAVIDQDSPAYLERLHDLGATGWITKAAALQNIIDKIYEVMLRPRPAFVSPSVDSIGDAAGAPKPKGTKISNRQFDILIRLVKGQSVSTIAAEIGVHIKTVSSHKISLQKKLGVEGTVGLVRYAMERQLV